MGSSALAISQGTAGTPGAPGAPGAMVLIGAGSGTSIAAGATNVDTCAITGLTAKDTLLVYATIISDAQDTASPALYNSTDSVQITSLSGAGTAVADVNFSLMAAIRQNQRNNTDVSGVVSSGRDSGSSAVVAGHAIFTTAWTGSWTLALRHGGVTAGGTFRYSWAVFKVAGQ